MRRSPRRRPLKSHSIPTLLLRRSASAPPRRARVCRRVARHRPRFRARSCFARLDIARDQPRHRRARRTVSRCSPPTSISIRRSRRPPLPLLLPPLHRAWQPPRLVLSLISARLATPLRPNPRPRLDTTPRLHQRPRLITTRRPHQRLRSITTPRPHQRPCLVMTFRPHRRLCSITTLRLYPRLRSIARRPLRLKPPRMRLKISSGGRRDRF